MALWQPSKERIADSNLRHFMSALEATHNIKLPDSDALYEFSVKQPEAFWQAMWSYNNLPFSQGDGDVISNKDDMFKARFFESADVNFAEALLTRRDDEIAIYFKCEDRETLTLSWAELYHRTASFADSLKNLGVTQGDRVAGYLPNMPEAIIGFLATASLGAVWTSCSPDFGVAGVLDRFGQSAPKVLIASDGYYYNGKPYDIQGKVKELTQNIPSIEATFIVPFLQQQADTDIANAYDFTAATQNNCELTYNRVPFNSPLYILYSSGTTGKPKCIVHGTGGVLLKHLSEHQLQCDLKGDDKAFFFTTCGWMMWNWLVTSLASQSAIVLYEGSPLHPNENILWDYAEEIGITHFGVSPKYLDALENSGAKPINTHKLTKLRCLLTAGSPLLPEQFDFVYQGIKQDVHLASISGGTDIVGLFVGGDPTKPVHRGEIQSASFGVATEVYDESAKPISVGRGELVCTAPFPSQPVAFWNDERCEKYFSAYFNHFEGIWHHGDFIERTKNGGYIIHGRSDATLNPAGVRIGTAEIYAQTEALPEILEAIVVGQEWQGDIRIILFVRLADGASLDDALQATIKQNIKHHCSPRHVPAKIIQVSDIPRTRSGKITELAVRDIIHGKPITNQTALANPEALKLFENISELES